MNYYIGTIIFDIEYSYKSLENKLIKKILSKKSLFIVGIIFNLGLLGYFKYYNFFLENIRGCIKIIFDTSRIRKGGFEFESSLLHIILL